MSFLHSLLFFAVSLAQPDSGSPSVTAALSQTVTSVNQPVQLSIAIRPAGMITPPKISAPGLSITYAGQSMGIQTGNGHTTTSTTLNYVVLPDHAGSFVIPPVAVELGNKRYQTDQLTLKVEQAASDSNQAEGKPYFAEFIVPKDTAYVGEAIPIELRFYFDRRIWYEPYPQGQLPIIEGGDFVIKKYPAPSEKQQTLNGRDYQVLVYKTAITGVKSGRLALQSAYQEFMVRMPVSHRSAPGTDDFFDQSPLPNPFDTFERKDVKIEAPGSTIEIKPLPDAGKPASFSGAIGRFTMATEAAPTQTRVGDPVTLKVSIEGLGSFDRMDAPILIDAQKWKIYQPASDFSSNDDLGLSGVRTFRFAAVPLDTVSRTPVIEFSYFDPESEKFVTLRSHPMLIRVEGRSLPEPDALSSSGSPAMPLASASPPPAAEILDIQNSNSLLGSFVPLVQRPVFWFMQAIPAGVLLLLGAGIWFKNFQAANAPMRALRAERSVLYRQLDQTDPHIVLSSAVRLLTLASTGKTGKGPTVSAKEAIGRRSVPADLNRELESLVARHDRVVYGHAGHDPISEDERVKIKRMIRQWESAS
jgi:hypothetical protein